MKAIKISGIAGAGLRSECRDGLLSASKHVDRGLKMQDESKIQELQKALALLPFQPDDALVRQPVVEALWPESIAKIWLDIKAGKFPAPVKISARNVAWRVGDLREFLARERPPANLGVNPVAAREAMNHDS